MPVKLSLPTHSLPSRREAFPFCQECGWASRPTLGHAPPACGTKGAGDARRSQRQHLQPQQQGNDSQKPPLLPGKGGLFKAAQLLLTIPPPATKYWFLNPSFLNLLSLLPLHPPRPVHAITAFPAEEVGTLKSGRAELQEASSWDVSSLQTRHLRKAFC